MKNSFSRSLEWHANNDSGKTIDKIQKSSSVDPKSEVKICKNIFKEFSGKTFLASIHKMNLLKYFDRIVIFENGKIVEDGTFEELYKRNEDFKRQWDEYVSEK